MNIIPNFNNRLIAQLAKKFNHDPYKFCYHIQVEQG